MSFDFLPRFTTDARVLESFEAYPPVGAPAVDDLINTLTFADIIDDAHAYELFFHNSTRHKQQFSGSIYNIDGDESGAGHQLAYLGILPYVAPDGYGLKVETICRNESLAPEQDPGPPLFPRDIFGPEVFKYPIQTWLVTHTGSGEPIPIGNTNRYAVLTQYVAEDTGEDARRCFVTKYVALCGLDVHGHAFRASEPGKVTYDNDRAVIGTMYMPHIIGDPENAQIAGYPGKFTTEASPKHLIREGVFSCCTFSNLDELSERARELGHTDIDSIKDSYKTNGMVVLAPERELFEGRYVEGGADSGPLEIAPIEIHSRNGVPVVGEYVTISRNSTPTDGCTPWLATSYISPLPGDFVVISDGVAVPICYGPIGLRGSVKGSWTVEVDCVNSVEPHPEHGQIASSAPTVPAEPNQRTQTLTDDSFNISKIHSPLGRGLGYTNMGSINISASYAAQSVHGYTREFILAQFEGLQASSRGDDVDDDNNITHNIFIHTEDITDYKEFALLDIEDVMFVHDPEASCAIVENVNLNDGWYSDNAGRSTTIVGGWGYTTAEREHLADVTRKCTMNLKCVNLGNGENVTTVSIPPVIKSNENILKSFHGYKFNADYKKIEDLLGSDDGDDNRDNITYEITNVEKVETKRFYPGHAFGSIIGKSPGGFLFEGFHTVWEPQIRLDGGGACIFPTIKVLTGYSGWDAWYETYGTTPHQGGVTIPYHEVVSTTTYIPSESENETDSATNPPKDGEKVDSDLEGFDAYLSHVESVNETTTSTTPPIAELYPELINDLKREINIQQYKTVTEGLTNVEANISRELKEAGIGASAVLKHYRLFPGIDTRSLGSFSIRRTMGAYGNDGDAIYGTGRHKEIHDRDTGYIEFAECANGGVVEVSIEKHSESREWGGETTVTVNVYYLKMTIDINIDASIRLWNEREKELTTTADVGDDVVTITKTVTVTNPAKDPNTFGDTFTNPDIGSIASLNTDTCYKLKFTASSGCRVIWGDGPDVAPRAEIVWNGSIYRKKSKIVKGGTTHTATLTRTDFEWMGSDEPEDEDALNTQFSSSYDGGEWSLDSFEPTEYDEYELATKEIVDMTTAQFCAATEFGATSIAELLDAIDEDLGWLKDEINRAYTNIAISDGDALESATRELHNDARYDWEKPAEGEDGVYRNSSAQINYRARFHVKAGYDIDHYYGKDLLQGAETYAELVPMSVSAIVTTVRQDLYGHVPPSSFR